MTDIFRLSGGLVDEASLSLSVPIKKPQYTCVSIYETEAAPIDERFLLRFVHVFLPAKKRNNIVLGMSTSSSSLVEWNGEQK